MPKLKITHQYELTKAYQQQLQQLEDTKWPNAQPDDPKLLQFLLIEDQKIIAHAGLDLREYILNNQTYKVAGVCGVITHPDYLNKGLATYLLKECIRYIESKHIDFSIFSCSEDLVEFYTKAGWRRSPFALIGGVENQPFSSKDLGLTTMIYFHSSMSLKMQQRFLSMDIFIPLGEHKLW